MLVPPIEQGWNGLHHDAAVGIRAALDAVDRIAGAGLPDQSQPAPRDTLLAAERARLRDLVTSIDPKSYADDPGFSVAINRVLAVLREPEVSESAPDSENAYARQARLQATNHLVATLHGRSTPCRCPACSGPESVAAPSVGTGTPAEERQRITDAIRAEMLPINSRYVGTTEAATGYLDGLSAALGIVGEGDVPAEAVSGGSGHADRQHAEERLALAERHARQARVDAGLFAGQRDVALAEVARYRAAIEAAVNSIRHDLLDIDDVPDIDETRGQLRQATIRLAAALGDGA
jgi:hypothetical protein